ncbi:MAG: VWA domain-containing protein [Candidatus Aminicenantes bacterium]|nr:MAG: VWA domain-containing protein [Candidatus Aminicenantes bacterium]
MRRNIFKLSIAFILLMVFLSVPGQAVRQAEGIDLVLLIDESGSMGGYGEHPQPNDPNNKRNELLHIILPEIVESAYKGNVFRISVIEFGSRHGSAARWRPEVTLSMYKIEKSKTGESQSDYLQRISTELGFLRTDRTRGYSDHGKALDLAVEEINRLTNQTVPKPTGHVGVTDRLKVVFLITDGMPYVQDTRGMSVAPEGLKKEIKEMVQKFPHQKAVLFVFGLNDADRYWDDKGYGDFWDLNARTTMDNKQKKGYAQFIDNHVEMIKQILPVLSRYTNPPGVNIIHGDTFDCPPYLKSLEFIVEFPRSFMKVSQVLEITQPDGNLLDTTNAREDKVKASIDVPYPQGGVWRFNRKDKDVGLMVKVNYQTVKFLSPLSPVPLRSTHKIKFKAFGRGQNNAFVQEPGFPLTANVFIETPQDTRDQLNATMDSNDPGVFISNSGYTFNQAGQYKVEFEASTVSGSGNPLVVLKSNKENLQVTDSTPVELIMEEPMDKTTSCFGSINQGFNFGFYTTGDNKKIPLQDILDTTKKIEATIEIMDASSRVKIISTDINLEPINDTLTGTVEMKLPFTDILNIILGKRDMNVTVTLDNDFLKDKYCLTPPQTDSSLYEFQLKVGEWFWTYLLLLIILGLIVFLIILLVILLGRTMCSKDIPVLVYRQETIIPDERFTQKIEVDKRIIKIKKGDKTFFIPDSSEAWKPKMKIKRNCTDKGVNVTLIYEKFGKGPGDRKGILQFLLEKLKIKPRDESKERFRKIDIQTSFPQRPAKHLIEELDEKEMIFELQVKGERSQ